MNPAAEGPGRRALLWFALFLIIAGGLQTVFSAYFHIGVGQPDFVLTLALTAALLSDATTGAMVGLAAGLVSSSLVGQLVGTFLVSRTIAGFVAGGFTARLYGNNPGVLLLGVFAGSVVGEVVFGLAAPRLTFLHWVWSILIGSALNALLAIPLFFLLRRCGWGKRT